MTREEIRVRRNERERCVWWIAQRGFVNDKLYADASFSDMMRELNRQFPLRDSEATATGDL